MPGIQFRSSGADTGIARARVGARLGIGPGKAGIPATGKRPESWGEQLKQWLADRLVLALLAMGRGLLGLTAGAWLHRYRLAPQFVSLALLVVAGVGHLLAPSDLAAGGAALGLAAAVSLRALRLGRPVMRAYVRVTWGMAAAWLALAWGTGLTEGTLVALAAGGTLASIPWWWHCRTRSGVQIEWVDLGALWTEGRAVFVRRLLPVLVADLRTLMRAHRELAGYRRDWPITTAQAGGGLANSQIVEGRFAEHRVGLGVDLAGGRHLEEIAVPELESALDVEHGSVSVRARPGSARRISIEIVRAGPPLPERIAWSGREAISVFQAIEVGEFRGGRKVRLRLVHASGEERGTMAGHIAIGGQTGWGKGVLIRRMLDHLTACPDAEVHAVDLKGGVDMHHWKPLLAGFATNPHDGARLLQAVKAEMERREVELVRRGDDNWMQRPGDRLLVLIVDELAQLDAAGKELLDTIVRMGRAMGILVVAATQRWSAAASGKEGTGDLRSQFAVKISFAVDRPIDGEMLFGHRLYRPDRLAVRGRALIYGPVMDYTSPEHWQGYLMPGGRAVREIVARRLPARSRSDADPIVGEGSASRVVPLAPSLLTPSAEPAPPEQSEAGGRRDDRRDLVRNALAEAGFDGITAKELTRAIGLGNSQTYRHLSQLVKAGEAVKVPGTSRYQTADLRPRLVVQEETR